MVGVAVLELTLERSVKMKRIFFSLKHNNNGLK